MQARGWVGALLGSLLFLLSLYHCVLRNGNSFGSGRVAHEQRTLDRGGPGLLRSAASSGGVRSGSGESGLQVEVRLHFDLCNRGVSSNPLLCWLMNYVINHSLRDSIYLKLARFLNFLSLSWFHRCLTKTVSDAFLRG